MNIHTQFHTYSHSRICAHSHTYTYITYTLTCIHTLTLCLHRHKGSEEFWDTGKALLKGCMT